MVFQQTDVKVIKENTTTGLDQTMVLNTDYTVALNPSQNLYPGGTITLLAGALAAGFGLFITSALPNLQSTDLTNSGGFYPEVLTSALDYLTILIQQIVVSLAIGYGETIPTAGQTVFTVPTYTPGANNLLVTAGGVVLTNGLDYTETNPTTITLTQPAAADEVYVFRVI
jgi:hypothetical protein